MKMNRLILKAAFLLIFLPIKAFAQEPAVKIDASDVDAPQIFTYVTQMPQPPYELTTYLSSHCMYPSSAARKGMQGHVRVQFVLDEQGDISDITLLNHVCPAIDSEAVRVVREMPRWNPGIQAGRPVKVYYTIPIEFKLDGVAAPALTAQAY